MLHITFLIGILVFTCYGVQYQGHLKPLGSYPPLQSVAVLDSIPTPEYFYKWFVKPGQPVLLRSVLNNPDFKNPAYKLWTDDYLREKYGKSEITYELHKKETRSEEDLQETYLQNFLNEYSTADVYMVQDLQAIPRMMEDVYLPPFIRCGGTQKLLTLYNMWFSSGGTKSVLHLDTMDNINCLYDGSKDIIFYDKKYQDDIMAHGFIEMKGYSTVDVDKVDLDKFPRFKSLPWIKAQMKKGDCLFIPQDWFHQVNSFGTRNLAVNQWFKHPLWFNTSDCEMKDLLHVDLPLRRFPAGFGAEVSRAIIFESYEEYPHLSEQNLKTLLKDGEKSKDLFDYMNTNMDDSVSWEEVHQMNFQDFVNKFKNFFNEEIQDEIGAIEDYYAQREVTEDQHREREKTEL